MIIRDHLDSLTEAINYSLTERFFSHYVHSQVLIMTAMATLNNPELFTSYASMTEKQQSLYNNLRLSHTFMILNAGNDVNGNPRRIWCISEPETGEVLFAYDEGYYGRDCVPGRVRPSFDYAPHSDCTFRQYQMLLKLPHPKYLEQF